MQPLTNKKPIRKYEINWECFPAIVFESDDWGACEVAPDKKTAEKYLHLSRQFERTGQAAQISCLETLSDLDMLFNTLVHKPSNFYHVSYGVSEKDFEL